MNINLRWPHSHKWVALASTMDEYGVTLVCSKCLNEVFYRRTPMQRINYSIIQAIRESDILIKRIMGE